MTRTVVIMLAGLACALAVHAQENARLPASTRVLALEDAVRLALDNAVSLRQAEVEETIALGGVREAIAGLFPPVEASASFAFKSPGAGSGQPAFLSANAIRQYQGFITVSGTLSLGLRGSIQRARAALAAARAGTDAARSQLVQLTSEMYYTVALAETQQVLMADTLRAAERFEETTRSMFNAGEVPEADLQRAQLQTGSRRSELQQAVAARTATIESLRVLIGDTEGVNFSTDQTITGIVDVGEGPPVTVIENHPEVRRAIAERESAVAEASIMRAARWPSLVLSFGRGFDSESLRSSVLRQRRGKVAMTGITWTLFDWGAASAREAQARARVQWAELRIEHVRRELTRDWRSAAAVAESASSRLRLLRETRLAAERNLRTAESRYRAGEGAIIEVTDAHTLLVAQTAALNAAAFDLATARARIDALTSRGGVQ